MPVKNHPFHFSYAINLVAGTKIRGYLAPNV
nr:MAG TPA: hypothetical protein [Caudoviricetes sp.]